MKRILVIDDSEVNLFLISAIFENDTDLKVQLLNKSSKALSILREGNVDLLVLDLMMPHVDGFQLLHAIKADPGLNHIPIIVVSARHDKEAIDKVMEYEVEAYIKKPVDLNALEQKVKSLLHLIKA